MPPKYEIILVLYQNVKFSNIAIVILDFSPLLHIKQRKTYRYRLSEQEGETAIAISIVGRVITIESEIKEWSNEDQELNLKKEQ